MTVIKANCRDKFTAADFQFICAALQKSTNDEKFLESLFADTDSRDLLLDDERLLHALLERPDYLNVSPHLYFYVLTRHTLRRAGLDDRELTDYVASMLFEFSRSESFKFTSRNHPEPLEHFFEMYSTLEETDTHTAFMVRAYMGNRSLFLSGIFPEHLAARTTRRGAPDISFYESMGSSSFRTASHHRLARQYHLDMVFDRLAEDFVTARKALNDLSDRMLTIDNRGASGAEAVLRRIEENQG